MNKTNSKNPNENKKSKKPKPLSKDATKLIDLIAEILAEDFVKAMKKEDENDESGNLR